MPIYKWFMLVFVLAACAAGDTDNVMAARDNLPSEATASGFAQWLAVNKAEIAAKEGFADSTIAALSTAEFKPKIIELDRKQPEFTLDLTQYQTRVLNQARITKGRTRFAEGKQLLTYVGNQYGVDPQVIVALWGIETDYGRITGGYDVISALATLAYEGRRASYFRRELINALKIIDEGHIKPAQFTGSWAGAMGQCQFMPSSFLSFAVDGNGDGKKDIWQNREDIFSSMANYLSRHGWDYGQPIAWPVSLPGNFDESLIGTDAAKSLTAWRKLGVQWTADLPSDTAASSLIKPSNAGGQVFMVTSNYRTLMKWNRSHLFALTVAKLADEITKN